MFIPVEVDHKNIRLIDIDQIESSPLTNMVDIEVQDDNSFCLADGLISHNSARNSIQSARGKNKHIGSFSLRGKPSNVYDEDIKDIIKPRKNGDLSEFANMMVVTGLQFGEVAKAESDGEWILAKVDGEEILLNVNDFITINGKNIKISTMI